MKIAVCIKQVPTREWQPRLTDDQKYIREQDASWELNEPDLVARGGAAPSRGARRRSRRLRHGRRAYLK